MPPALTVGLTAACGVALLLAGISFAYRVSRGKSDFLGLLRAAVEVRREGHFLTEHASPYPPSAYAIYQLYALLPLPLAAGLWFTLAALLYTATAWWLARDAVGVPPEARSAVFLTALALSSPWMALDLAQGNISSLLAFAAAGSFTLAERGRPWLAGLVLSLGIVMKPVPALILFFYAYKRLWRVVGSTLLFTGAIGLLAPILAFGPAEAARGWHLWYEIIGRNASPLRTVWLDFTQANFHSASALAGIVRVFGDVPADGSGYRVTLVHLPKWGIAAIWYALAAVVLLPALWVTRRPAQRLSRTRLAEELALYVVLMLFLSPLLMSYYLAITLIPVTVLVGRIVRADQCAGRRDRLTAGLVAAHVAWGVHMASRFLRAIGGSAAGLLILWAALMLRLRRQE
jgi:hypothetical protein